MAMFSGEDAMVFSPGLGERCIPLNRLQVDRRQFVRGLGGLSAFAALQPAIGSLAMAAPPAPKPRALIDAHCHPFNGRDVPIFGFLQRIVIGQYLAPWPAVQLVAEGLALWLATSIEGLAPGYITERAVLRKLSRKPSGVGEFIRKADPHDDRAPELRDFIAKGLNKFVDRHTSFGGAPPKSSEINDKVISVLGDLYGVDVLSAKDQAEIARVLNSPTTRKAAIAKLSDEIVQNLHNTTKTSSDEIKARISQFFAWAYEFTQLRFQSLMDLAARFDGNGTALRVLVPTIVDIEFWLRWPWYYERPTSMDQQAELIQLMSRIDTPRLMIFPGFIGFDPWRYLYDRYHHIHPNALEVVQTAISERGFIGVKLYPPMGFRASNNKALHASDFPLGLQELQQTFHPDQPNPGPALDDALAQLYAYCNQEELAIMAHCANTIGSRTDYALRADPMWWGPVVTNYPKLRVNLGHFGGIWDLCSETSCKNPDQSWPAYIAGLLSNKGLYVDVGDFSGVLRRWPDEDTTTTEILEALGSMVKDPALRQRIMYGSDWMLLDREPQNDRYYHAMRDRFTDLMKDYPGEVDSFFGRNAATFLGLIPGAKTRRRLDRLSTRTRRQLSELDRNLGA